MDGDPELTDQEKSGQGGRADILHLCSAKIRSYIK